MISQYRYRRRVQFHETDKVGIVHFSNYFRFIEEAEHAMWREAGLSIAPEGDSIGWPRVATSFEFKRPLKFENEFEVHIRVVAMGEKSLTYAATITYEQQEVANGRLTIACVRRTPDGAMKAVPIPAEIASRIEVCSDDVTT